MAQATAPHNPTRSIRVPDDVWERAKRRARHEGVSISKVCQMIVTGYAQGLIDLPKVTVHYENVTKE